MPASTTPSTRDSKSSWKYVPCGFANTSGAVECLGSSQDSWANRLEHCRQTYHPWSARPVARSRERYLPNSPLAGSAESYEGLRSPPSTGMFLDLVAQGASLDAGKGPLVTLLVDKPPTRESRRVAPR